MKIIVATNGNLPSKLANSFSVMKTAQGFLRLKNDVKVIAPLSLPIFINKIKIRDIHSFYGVDQNLSIKF